MGLFEGVLGGLANAAGATGVTDKIAERKKNRKNLSDQELQFETQSVLNDVSALHERKSKLDPKAPNYAQESQQIDKALHDAMGAFKDLYHPDNNPTGLSKLGGFLKSHLGGKKQPATPGEAKQSMQDRIAGIDSVAYAPQAKPEPAAPQNPILVKRQQMKEAGYSEEDIAKAEHRTLPGAPGAEPKPSHQTSDERARADFAEFKKSHPEYKGTFERWRKEQSTLPKAAAPAKPQRFSAAQNKAQSVYLEAFKLSHLADLVAKNPNDASNVKGFAIALERARAGRFTTQALDVMLQAGWANKLEQWANNPSTGTLPADVLRQLVEGAHQNLTASKDAMDEAMKLSPAVPATPGDAKKRMAGEQGNDSDVDEIVKALQKK